MDVRSRALSAAGSMLVSGVALYAVVAIVAPHPAQAADAADLAVGSPHVTPAQPSVNPAIDKIDGKIDDGDVPSRPGAPPLPGRPADLAVPPPALSPPPTLSPLPTENVATKIVHMPREDPGPPMREPNAAHTLVAPQGTVDVAVNGPAGGGAAAAGGPRPLPGVPADAAVDADEGQVAEGHVMEAPVAEADAAHNAAAMHAIAQLQRALPAHGYHVGPPSGRVDPETKLAILQYQHDAGLDADAYSAVSLEKTVDSVYYAAPPVMAADPLSASNAAISNPAISGQASAAAAAGDVATGDADDAASPGPVTASDRAKAAALASAWAHAFSPGVASPGPALNAVGTAPAGTEVASADTPAEAPQVSDTPAREQIAEMPEAAAPEAAVSEVAIRSRPAAQPAVASVASIDNDIASRAIAWVQQRLDLKGYDAGPATGRMGDYTADAIADFQVANGMKPTGQIDGALLDLLSRR